MDEIKETATALYVALLEEAKAFLTEVRDQEKKFFQELAVEIAKKKYALEQAKIAGETQTAKALEDDMKFLEARIKGEIARQAIRANNAGKEFLGKIVQGIGDLVMKLPIRF
jgi:hypothetical protein